jgi:hypothetical protein
LRHPRPPTLPRPQDLQPVPLHPLPDIERRAVDPERPARVTDRRPARARCLPRAAPASTRGCGSCATRGRIPADIVYGANKVKTR